MEPKSRTHEQMTSAVETRRDDVSEHEEMIRDQELSDAFVEEELGRWGRFLELSAEEALLSTEGMQEVFDIANAVPSLFTLTANVLGRLSDIKDGTALFLAVLGRGVSRCTRVNLNASEGHELEAKEAIAFCANLKSNTSIKKVCLEGQRVFGTPQMSAVCSNALTANHTLTRLNMTEVGMTPVALRCLLFGARSRSAWHPTKLETDLAVQGRKSSKDYEEISKLHHEMKMEAEKLERGGLWANATMQKLVLSENVLFDTTSLAVFLSKNPTLKSLWVQESGLDFLSARGIADALKWNTNLVKLSIHDNEIGYDGFRVMFESLAQNIGEAGTISSSNTTLKSLDIGGIGKSLSPGSLAVAPLVVMLETNTSLVHLTIRNMPFEVEHWTQQIFPALSKNKTLELLSLYGCKGLTGDGIYLALLKVVQESNTGLKAFGLGLTGMESSEGFVNAALEIRAQNQDRL